jgi:hypothetical protein
MYVQTFDFVCKRRKIYHFQFRTLTETKLEFNVLIANSQILQIILNLVGLMEKTLAICSLAINGRSVPLTFEYYFVQLPIN